MNNTTYMIYWTYNGKYPHSVTANNIGDALKTVERLRMDPANSFVTISNEMGQS